MTDAMKVALMDSIRRADSIAARTPRRALVEPSDLPDYRPPFLTGTARADGDGNIWVRENVAGSVYDMIGRDGKLVDRIAIPRDASIAGFGPGVVYLASRVEGRWQIAKVRIH